MLMNSIRPYDTGNNMTDFCTALYEQEYSARQVWRSQRQMMTRTYSARSSFSPISPVNHRNLGKPLPRPPTLSSAMERPTMPGSHIAQSRPRQRERDCRHCGGTHWDFECPHNLNKHHPARVLIMDATDDEKEPILLDEDEFRMFQEWRAQMQETSGIEPPAEPIIEEDDLGNPQRDH